MSEEKKAAPDPIRVILSINRKVNGTPKHRFGLIGVNLADGQKVEIKGATSGSWTGMLTKVRDVRIDGVATKMGVVKFNRPGVAGAGVDVDPVLPDGLDTLTITVTSDNGSTEETKVPADVYDLE
jgi:hypothetical protein